jgi:hypothetical protein
LVKAPRRRSLLALLLLAAGCAARPPGSADRWSPPARPVRAGVSRSAGSAGPAPGFRAARTPPRPKTERGRAIAAAEALVGERSIVVAGRHYGDDCAALVRAALDAAGHPLPRHVRDAAALHALAARKGALKAGAPIAGDLVFLSDRPGGRPSHVGIVSRVEPDGTALVLHRVSRGVVPIRVNMAWPERASDPGTGKRVNDSVVVGGERVTAAKLVVGRASLLRG